MAYRTALTIGFSIRFEIAHALTPADPFLVPTYSQVHCRRDLLLNSIPDAQLAVGVVAPAPETASACPGARVMIAC